MTKDSSYKLKREKILNISLISAAVIVGIVLVSYVVRLTTGVAKEVKAPAYDIRLEILNASGERDLDEKVKSYLDTATFEDVSVIIVEHSNFDIKESDKTFLINRTSDSKAAEKGEPPKEEHNGENNLEQLGLF